MRTCSTKGSNKFRVAKTTQYTNHSVSSFFSFDSIAIMDAIAGKIKPTRLVITLAARPQKRKMINRTSMPHNICSMAKLVFFSMFDTKFGPFGRPRAVIRRNKRCLSTRPPDVEAGGLESVIIQEFNSNNQIGRKQSLTEARE